MKPYVNAHRSPIAKGLPPFAEFRHRSYIPDPEASSPPFMFAPMLSGGGFMQPSVKSDMLLGNLPNLEAFCQELYQTFFRLSAPYSALQFLPALTKLLPPSQAAMDRFCQHSKTNHVLLKNDLLKVVLIHWQSGTYSRIHGHAQGGCVFKVLQGKLEEKRYQPDASQKLLSTTQLETGGIAYIDDQMAHHAVGNPFDQSAISIHAYTPGQ